jgi:hypothetical protein
MPQATASRSPAFSTRGKIIHLIEVISGLNGNALTNSRAFPREKQS